MADGKGTKSILSILIIMIVICIICYLVYEKKSVDLIFNQDDMIPNLFKAQPEQMNHQPVSQMEEVEEQTIDQVLQNDPVESFVSNTNLQNAAPITEKKSCLGSRDTFLLNQNRHYSNCNDDCLNKNLIEKYNNQFN